MARRPLADALYDRLLDAFPAGHAHPGEAFDQAPMPPPVAHFLRAQLRRRLSHEIDRLRAARSAWFDYGDPEVQAAGRAFRSALEQHAQVPADAWGSALREATRQVSAHLVRPVRTLVRYAFEEEDGERTVPHLLRRMEAFAAYPYLREAVKAYAEEHSLEAIDRTHTTALLTRVDRQMAADCSAGDWERLLDPLFAVSDAAFADRRGIPAGALEAFFAAKDAAEPQRRLEAEPDANGADFIDRAMLRRLLGGEEQEEQHDESFPEAISSANGAPAVEPAGNGDDAVAPRWMQFQSDEEAAPAADMSPPSAEVEGNEKEDRPLWQQFRSEEDGDTEAPAAPAALSATDHPADARAGMETLEQEILGKHGASNRIYFVEHLFDGSEEAYTHTLRRLQAASSWNEASRIIASEVFRKHEVNIYSEPAVTFTDAVETQFKK